MNCRPGDLAIQIRAWRPENIGTIVRVLRPVDDWFFGAGFWEVEGSGNGNVAADSDLHPIRDPGDDAKDEMLRPLPKEVTAW